MKSYLINLASRPDRLQHVTEQLHGIGIEFERFEAFTREQAGGNGPLAFNKSQYYCIKKAVEAGHERFAIFEDDVTFVEGAQQLIADAVNELPPHWAMLHLGCNIIGMSTTEWKMPTKYSEHLAECWNNWQTHAIVWKWAMAKSFLGAFPYHADEYSVEGLVIFDEWLRTHINQHGVTFVMRPMVAYQRPDVSDIWGTQGDYTSSFELGNKYLNSL